eukprot:1652018-Amphidinium_carterae.2
MSEATAHAAGEMGLVRGMGKFGDRAASAIGNVAGQSCLKVLANQDPAVKFTTPFYTQSWFHSYADHISVMLTPHIKTSAGRSQVHLQLIVSHPAPQTLEP